MIRKGLKKGTALCTMMALVLSLSACGNDASDGKDASGSAVSEVAAEADEEPVAEPTPTPDDGNLIKDGGFDGNSAWAVYKTSGGSGSSTIENNEMLVHISDVGKVQHGVQVYYDGFKLDQGAEYEYSFDARSTVPRTVVTRLQLNGGDYHAYYEEPIKLTDQMKTYRFTFTMDEASDPAPRLVFNLGYGGKSDKGVGEHDIYIDNVRLVLADDSNIVVAEELDPTGIRVNQVGFCPSDTKTAVFADVSTDQDEYKIVSAADGKEVYTGTLGNTVTNENAGETDRVADFSDFETPGTYRIVAADGTESPEFTIGDKVYDSLLKKAVKMLYLQRCGTALDKKHAGKFAHKKCHTKKAHIYWDRDKTKDVSGGWHDAGDYGRYVVAGAKAAADVLLAYENYASQKKIIDDVGTVDSGDGIDDLLQEAKYELDWMLKMQTKDGRVYHKVTCLNFPSTVMPEEETEDLILSYTSSPATADFTAVMALAARIYGNTGNAAFKKAAKKYLKAAKKSWKWLSDHPDVKNYTNPDDLVTGEYPDTEDRDERFWAACELYRTTGESVYGSAIDPYTEEQAFMRGLGWTEVGLYGCYAALMNPNMQKYYASTTDTIRGAFTNNVMDTKNGSDANPYAVNRGEEYEWGSNLGIANDGVMYLMSDQINESMDYRPRAERQLSYLLGENATGYCFVTGFGTTSPEHPHHRVSQVVGKAIPGMLVGGPDSGLDDPYAQAVLTDRPPAKCYADSDQSYSTNEVTIYWNSPMILLLSGLMKK